jgi:hypothetical protein
VPPLQADAVANAETGIAQRENECAYAFRIVVTKRVALRVLVTGLENPLDLILGEHLYAFRWLTDLRRLHSRRRVRLDPTCAMAEPEKRPQPFEILLGSYWSVGPARTKLPNGGHVELLQQTVSLFFAPRQQALFEKVLVLRKCGRCALLAVLEVVQELPDRLADGRYSGLTTPISPEASQPRTRSEAASHERRSRLWRTYSPRSEP